MPGKVRVLHPKPELISEGLLSTLPPDQARRLLDGAIRMDVPAGAIVYREADPARCFVVVEGLFRSFLSSPDGRQVTFRYGRRGDSLALASVIGESLPLTIQAMTPSSLLAIRTEALREMVANDPEVARACAEELTRQLNEALDGAARNAFHTVRQRLARQLLDLAESDGHGMSARVSHQELADAIASSREVVSRTLHEMRADSLLETTHDHLVVLLDVDGLAREIAGARTVREAG
jgi:CRP/FNR family transcriptional regulator, cyclic AMP receptor protein